MMVDTVSPSSVVTATNPLPTHIQPSPVEMEHVSTSPDIATTGSLENGAHSLNIESQRPLKAEVRYLVDGKTSTTTFPLGSLQRMVRRHVLSVCHVERVKQRR